jgi:hypothetical protein
MYDNKGNPSHVTDVFEWALDVLSMKSGYGKLLPGQVRLTYEFKMQRSTSRYTERTVLQALPRMDSLFTKPGNASCAVQNRCAN